jgi:hypothetical protein
MKTPWSLCIVLFLICCQSEVKENKKLDVLNHIASNEWCFTDAIAKHCFRIRGNKLISTENGIDKNIQQLISIVEITDRIVLINILGKERIQKKYKLVSRDTLYLLREINGEFVRKLVRDLKINP